MPLLLLLILVPLIELYVLISVGSVIGGFTTVMLTLLTAASGIFLVRHQGLGVLRQAQAEAAAAEAEGRAPEPPVKAVFDGLCLLTAGIFLLIPGFVTDLFGFLLLIPGLRRLIGGSLWSGVGRHGQVFIYRTGARQADRGASRRQDRPPVIEGDYRRVDGERDDGSRD